jgi:hypothetical protein
MVEERQRRRTIFPNARRPKTTPPKPWRSAEGLPKHINTEKEWNKFQIRANEPGARAAEQQVFNDYRSQGLYPWNLHSRPELDWSEGKQDILRWDVRPANVERVDPVINTGITNPNLGGAKVMNAASPFDFSADDNWLRQFGQYMKRYLPGYDPEADEYRQKKADPLEGELQGGMRGLPHEPNPLLTDQYNDKIIRDLYPQTFGGPAPYTTDEELYNLLEGLESEDLGMEPHLEANLSQTWQDIVDRTGNEDLANEWLATQQSNRGGLMSLT